MNNVSATEIRDLRLDLVYANPDQPRKDFDEAKLKELAMSIREHGVLEPIVVCQRGDRFMIICGERRYRASLLADKTDIPVRIIEADDALVDLDRQAEIFALTPLTEYEKDSVETFEKLMKSAERLLGRLKSDNRMKHLEKASMHSEITPERIQFVIKGLQEVRRVFLVGDGVKEAQKEKAAV